MCSSQNGIRTRFLIDYRNSHLKHGIASFFSRRAHPDDVGVGVFLGVF